MDDELERRWDDAVETAWRGFRQRLADRLAELEDGGLVMVDTEEDYQAWLGEQSTFAELYVPTEVGSAEPEPGGG